MKFRFNILLNQSRPLYYTGFIKLFNYLFIFVQYSKITTKGKTVLCKQLAVHVCRICAKSNGNYGKRK